MGRAGPRGRALPLLGAVLGLAAYGGLLVPDPTVPTETEVEGLFFDPEHLPAAAAMLVAAWLAWRRLPAFRALPERRSRAAWPLYGVALLSAVWSALNQAPDWRVLSLGAQLLAFAAISKGGSGLRAMALPCFALLFALPIPDPLENELLWGLQRIAAQLALALHGLFGLGTTGQGVMLHRGEDTFLVIETCSGLRTLLTLGLVSLVIRDLFPEAGRRGVLIILASPVVAIVANGVRVAWIATEGAEAAAGHVGQGMMTLLGGTVALFALGQLLAGAPRPRVEPAAPAPGAWPWQATCLSLLLVNMAVHVSAAWELPEPVMPPVLTEIDDRRGWVGTGLTPDRFFLGNVRIGLALHERFERKRPRSPRMAVELFIGLEAPGMPRQSPFSSKLLLPGRDWVLHRSERRRHPRLFRDVDELIATRGGDMALSVVWRPGNERSGAENLRSFFALERGPFARPRARSVVRVATAMPDDSPASIRAARERIDAFLVDYGDVLDSLEGPS